MALYVPSLYLEIAEFAVNRGIEPEKLTKGLDLQRMAIPDADEDAATMAAHAILDLIQKNGLDPRHIHRIYMGTESAVDAAKPTASYTVGMLEAALEATFGPRSFRNCDVVDMTFACVAATDALQNCIDYVRLRPDSICIAVASDVAKYELGSSGEYTQGAGAVALLVKANPRLMTFTDAWGVGMESVHDFFKPRRTFPKSDIVQTVLQEAGITNGLSLKVAESLARKGENVFTWPDASVSIFREMPVFDGQYSNQCYVARAQEALDHFRQQTQPDGSTLQSWRKVICHLPYAAHGRRIGIELLMHECAQIGSLATLLDEAGVQPPAADASPKEQAGYLKAMSQTPTYRRFIAEKLADAQRACAQVGNMYTGSVWLALLSALEAELDHTDDISGQRYGFVAYGSGSKSKVFEGTLQPQWSDVVRNFGIMARLDRRRAISFDTYEALHRGDITAPIVPSKTFRLESIGAEGELEGARRYAVVMEAVTA